MWFWYLLFAGSQAHDVRNLTIVPHAHRLRISDRENVTERLETILHEAETTVIDYYRFTTFSWYMRITLRRSGTWMRGVRMYHENVVDHYENPRNVGSLHGIPWAPVSWALPHVVM